MSGCAGSDFRRWLDLGLLWLAVLVTALLTRPLLPVDETRYLAVAWEMWQRGDFLVPHLNGEPYAHKPPLLFWLIHAGWALFGVSETWGRLVAPVVSLASLFLAARLARALWPDAGASVAIPWLLFGTLVWTGFFTLTQFDMLLVFCVLLGALGLWQAAAGRTRGWLWLTLALGLGLLAKGPVILLHLLPLALAAPLWAARPARGWAGWYGRIGLGLLGGAAMVLAWAIPAAIAGGPEYREAIFWGQTANRVVDSFAHRQPFWWYLPVFPLMLLPWLAWPRLWAPVLDGAQRRTQPLRFLGVSLLLVLAGFSLVSGKQVKYLLPLLPAALLLAALGWSRLPARPARAWPAVALLLVTGVALLLLPRLGHAPWMGDVDGRWGVIALALAVALAWLPIGAWSRLRVVTAASALAVVLLHLAVVRVAAPAYDLAPLSREIARLQAAGVPLAHVGKYHGQFHFLGRLTRPIAVVPEWEALDWARAHPEGYLVLQFSHWQGLRPEDLAWLQDYRGDADDLALVAARALLAADAAASR